MSSGLRAVRRIVRKRSWAGVSVASRQGRRSRRGGGAARLDRAGAGVSRATASRRGSVVFLRSTTCRGLQAPWEGKPPRIRRERASGRHEVDGRAFAAILLGRDPQGDALGGRHRGTASRTRSRTISGAAPEGTSRDPRRNPTISWWAVTGSNRRPSRCKRDALPTELTARPRVPASSRKRRGRPHARGAAQRLRSPETRKGGDAIVSALFQVDRTAEPSRPRGSSERVSR